MKYITALLVLLVATTWTLAQNTLHVKIDKIQNNKGNIIVGLFDNEQDFPRKAMDGKIVKASKSGVTVVFNNVKPGKYAVSVLHDENKNKDLDQNKLGIPKEGYGFSNNAKGSLGPPSFDKAIIDLPAAQRDTSIAIEMRYLGSHKE